MYSIGMSDNTYLDVNGDGWLKVKNFVALEVESWTTLCVCSVEDGFFRPKSVSAIHNPHIYNLSGLEYEVYNCQLSIITGICICC